MFVVKILGIFFNIIVYAHDLYFTVSVSAHETEIEEKQGRN